MIKAAHDVRPVVVVSEDELLLRMFTADFLDEAGYKVFEAANADEALVILKVQPDVQALVTDVEMPHGSINGFELARRVYQQSPGVAIVIVSGRERPGPNDLPRGAMFLSKPYDPACVLNELRDLLAHRATREA